MPIKKAGHKINLPFGVGMNYKNIDGAVRIGYN